MSNFHITTGQNATYVADSPKKYKILLRKWKNEGWAPMGEAPKQYPVLLVPTGYFSGEGRWREVLQFEILPEPAPEVPRRRIEDTFFLGEM